MVWSAQAINWTSMLTVELISLCTGICYDCHSPLRLVSPIQTNGNGVGRLTTIHSWGSHWAPAGLELIHNTDLSWGNPSHPGRKPCFLGLFQAWYQLYSFLLFFLTTFTAFSTIALAGCDSGWSFSSTPGKQTPRKAVSLLGALWATCEEVQRKVQPSAGMNKGSQATSEVADPE